MFSRKFETYQDFKREALRMPFPNILMVIVSTEVKK
jgi:hypothetical protein